RVNLLAIGVIPCPARSPQRGSFRLPPEQDGLADRREQLLGLLAKRLEPPGQHPHEMDFRRLRIVVPACNLQFLGDGLKILAGIPACLKEQKIVAAKSNGHTSLAGAGLGSSQNLPGLRGVRAASGFPDAMNSEAEASGSPPGPSRALIARLFSADEGTAFKKRSCSRIACDDTIRS